jgi:hypothetical protein
MTTRISYSKRLTKFRKTPLQDIAENDYLTYPSFCEKNNSSYSQLLKEKTFSRKNLISALEVMVLHQSLIDYSEFRLVRNDNRNVQIDEVVKSSAWFAYSLNKNLFTRVELGRINFGDLVDPINYIDVYHDIFLLDSLLEDLIFSPTASISQAAISKAS